jgi:hypothetical protein
LPANTSATGGYLVPASPAPAPAPITGQTLRRFLSQVFVGITGLPGAAVRPRWQPEPPNQPDLLSDWMAFGITSRTADWMPAIEHQNTVTGDPPVWTGADLLIRNEEFTVLCSFYGPDAESYAELLREGINVPQNREALFLAGMAHIETQDITTLPSLVKERWLYRVDMPIRFRRQIRQLYPILNLLTANLTITEDLYDTVTPIIVEQS